MDPETLELLRCLHMGPYDAAGLTHLEALLQSQRAALRGRGDLGTLTELGELLEEWSGSVTDAGVGARTLLRAAEVAETDLLQPERAIELYEQALRRDPTQLHALERLHELRAAVGQLAELETAMAAQASALDSLEAGLRRSEGDQSPSRYAVFRAAVYTQLGELRADEQGDLPGAIDAFERALDAEPDTEVIRKLAELLVMRRGEGDRQRAADLYCTLGDALDDAEAIGMLELALDQLPGHSEALALLESKLPATEHAQRLKVRWAAFIEDSAHADPAEVDARRLLLARAYAADERYRDALLCIAPVAAKGDTSARQLREAFVANLEGHQEEVGTSQSPEVAPARALPTRSGHTMVGIRLPQGADEEALSTFDRKPIAPSQPPPPSAADVAHPSSPARAPASATSTQPLPPLVLPDAVPFKAAGAAPEAAPAPTSRSSAPASASVPPRLSGPPPASAGPAGPTVVAIAAPPAASLHARLSKPPPAARAAAGASNRPQTGITSVAAAAPRTEATAGAALTPKPAVAPNLAPIGNDLDDEAKARPRTAWAGNKRVMVAAGAVVALGVLGLALRGRGPSPAPTPSPAAAAATAAAPALPAPSPAVPAPPPAAAADTAPPARAAPAAAHPTPKARPKPEVHVLIEQAKVHGGKLSKAQLEAGFAGVTDKLERCYQQTLKQSPRVHGELPLVLGVAKTGRVTTTKTLKGEVTDRALLRCTLQAVHAAQFAKPGSKPAEVRVPIEYVKQ